MKLIIDIPEEHYRKICKRQEDAIIAHDTCRRIAHGTALPEVEGDLIDRIALREELENLAKDEFDSLYGDGIYRAIKSLNVAPAVITIDKGEYK